MATMSGTVWSASMKDYGDWSEDLRQQVETFLVAHGIDPKSVPVATSAGNEWYIRATDNGFVLNGWMFDREDGRIVACPHCPSCAKHKRVEVPLAAAVPPIPGGWAMDEKYRALLDAFESSEGGRHA